MVGVSILPIAKKNNKLYFLFGQEQNIEYGIRGYSDFGGGREDESIFDGAIREGCEEIKGFLGDEKQLRKRVLESGGTHLVNYNDKYYVHIFLMEYNENLPKYFTNNHNYIWNKMNKKVLSKTKIFEKRKLEWFKIKDMKKTKKEFRPFYVDILEKIIKDEKNIKKFANKMKNKTRKKKNTKNKTRKK